MPHDLGDCGRAELVDGLMVERFTPRPVACKRPEVVDPDAPDACARRRRALAEAVESLPVDRCRGCGWLYGEHYLGCARAPVLRLVTDDGDESREAG